MPCHASARAEVLKRKTMASVGGVGSNGDTAQSEPGAHRHVIPSSQPLLLERSKACGAVASAALIARRPRSGGS